MWMVVLHSRGRLYAGGAERMSTLAAQFAGQMILAPLTRGGNLPFRRLCADFGCNVSMSEMVFARHLVKGDKRERARLRRGPNEGVYGVQIATNNAEEGARAAVLAADAGADFVDLNCGCPIHEATRRGLGSALLRNPRKLHNLVAGIAEASPLPVSVKIRIGVDSSRINVREVTAGLREAGAAAVTIHGRTAEQRYQKSADWGLIRTVVDDNAAVTAAAAAGGGVAQGGSGQRVDAPHMPIVGNGDILTHYEARQRMELSGVDAVMVSARSLARRHYTRS
jgi:tRNA-dihydrouridine synthase 3